MQRIGQLWRLFGTGVSFLIFGIGGLVLGLLLFPALLILLPQHIGRQKLARRTIARCFSAFVWLMKSLGVLAYEIIGDPEAAPNRNCLIVANHPTLIDVVFLIALFPHADCVIKSALWRNPFTRGAVSAANYISNDNSAEVIERCVNRLRGGSSLILFPEGTRTGPQAEPVFKLGAAAVAVGACAVVQPVLIRCDPPTLYKRDAWYNTPSRKPFFQFEILAPLEVVELAPTDAGPRQQRRAFNAALERFFRERLAAPPRVHSDRGTAI
jgi:1-acyl-sn-glycerol-3-phosphate acyltransferase